MKFSEIPAGTSYSSALTTLSDQILVKVRYRSTDGNKTTKYGALVVIDRTTKALDRLIEQAKQEWSGEGRLEYQIVHEDTPDFWDWETISDGLEETS